MNYRKYYSEYYGITFGRDMCVHRMDFNHYNNDIQNLLLLPKKLHSKYHFCISALGGQETEFLKVISLNYYSESKTKIFCRLSEVMKELGEWVHYKNELDMILLGRRRLHEIN